MNINIIVKAQDEPKLRTSLLVGAFQDKQSASFPKTVLERTRDLKPVSLQTLSESGEISGIFKEYTLIHADPSFQYPRVIVMGLGERKRFSADILRSISAKAARTLRKVRCETMAVYPEDFEALSVEEVSKAILEGVLLGTYRSFVYRKEKLYRPTFKTLVLYVSSKCKFKVEQAVYQTQAICTATNQAKDWINLPGNKLYPELLAKEAEDAFKNLPVSVRIWDEKALKGGGFGGILAVGQGSVHPPRLIELDYNSGQSNLPKIALVGKGVTFDSGGISLKPVTGMGRMKYDMAGAAVVLAVFQAVAKMQLPIHLMGLVPTAENMPSAAAYRPGDVIHMWDGTTVEILSTDAEGRMLLGDALAYASSKEPDLIIDLATLTGGCVTALGHIAAGLMSNNERLAKDLELAAMQTDEYIWRLPLFRQYAIQLKSIVADLVNSGGRPASAVTAGLFLRHFVNVPWAHFDIAGTAWIDESTIQYFHRPYTPKRGATGFGVRLLTQFLLHLSQQVQGDRQKLKDRLDHDESLLDDPVDTLRMPQGGW